MKKVLNLIIIGMFLFSVSLVIAEQNIEIYAHTNGTNGNSGSSVQGDSSNNQNESTPPMPELYSSPTNGKGDGLGNTIRNRVHAGNYTTDSGETVQVKVMAQNRTKLQVKNASAHTGLEIVDIQENGTIYRFKAELSNGKNAEIKVMPDVASEKALNRLKLKVCNESNNCSVELKEVANKGNFTNNATIAYELQAQRHFRILGMFKTKAEVRAQVNAETGDIIKIDKPWWAFLASEKEE